MVQYCRRCQLQVICSPPRVYHPSRWLRPKAVGETRCKQAIVPKLRQNHAKHRRRPTQRLPRQSAANLGEMNPTTPNMSPSRIGTFQKTSAPALLAPEVKAPTISERGIPITNPAPQPKTIAPNAIATLSNKRVSLGFHTFLVRNYAANTSQIMPWIIILRWLLWVSSRHSTSDQANFCFRPEAALQCHLSLVLYTDIGVSIRPRKPQKQLGFRLKKLKKV